MPDEPPKPSSPRTEEPRLSNAMDWLLDQYSTIDTRYGTAQNPWAKENVADATEPTMGGGDESAFRAHDGLGNA